MTHCAIENSVLDKIEENNKLQDEYRQEQENDKINKDVYNYCGDVDEEFNDEKTHSQTKKKTAAKTAKKTNTKVVLSEKDKIVRDNANEQARLLESGKKKAAFMKQWLKDHGYETKRPVKKIDTKVIEPIKQEVQQDAMTEISIIKETPKEETIAPKDPMITVIRSKKSIEKSKTAYLDSFRKEMGGKEPTQEKTQKKGIVLRRRGSTDRSGR